MVARQLVAAMTTSDALGPVEGELTFLTQPEGREPATDAAPPTPNHCRRGPRAWSRSRRCGRCAESVRSLRQFHGVLNMVMQAYAKDPVHAGIGKQGKSAPMS